MGNIIHQSGNRGDYGNLLIVFIVGGLIAAVEVTRLLMNSLGLSNYLVASSILFQNT